MKEWASALEHGAGCATVAAARCPQGRLSGQEKSMTGQMIEFDANGTPAPGYLATPDGATTPTPAGTPEASAAPGVVVLHAWWGLTAPFRQVCDRLAAAGF